MNGLLVILEMFLMTTLLCRRTTAQTEGMARRVFYGDPAEIEKYPFFAGLSNCGSAILSNLWILTAAHCMEDPLRQKLGFVWVGGNYYNDSIIIPYHEVIVHPDFYDIDGVQVNDLALIKLDTPLQYSKTIQPAKLPSEDPHVKHLVLVTRGSDEVHTPVDRRKLKKVDLIKLSRLECLWRLPPHYVHISLQNREWLENRHICATRAGNIPSVCKGDSGSPLVSNDVLVGLHSFGNEICERGRIGYFTNVFYYVPWIKNITGL